MPKLIKILLLLQTLIYLNSCGIYRPTDAREFPPEPEKRVQKNIEEGRGFRILGQDKNKTGGVFDFATSNELWRASLDVLDFMPLLTADYGGGLIVTDWYNDGSSEDSIKISVRFLTNEIRSDALKINVFAKQCGASDTCKITENNSQIKSKLTESILRKAASYKKEKDNKK